MSALGFSDALDGEDHVPGRPLTYLRACKTGRGLAPWFQVRFFAGCHSRTAPDALDGGLELRSIDARGNSVEEIFADERMSPGSLLATIDR